jgi:hypothetical protein
MATLEETKRQSHRVSGVSNIAYDLVTILQNKLQSVAAMQEYKQDAQEQKDDQAIKLLNELESRACEDITRLRQMVADRLH